MSSLFKIKANKTNDMYESLLIGMFLAFAGGLLDVYTYVLKGGVFAFAQTGNMLLMVIKFANGNWQGAIYYLIPITAFIMGIFLTEYLKIKLDDEKFMNCSNIVIIFEIIMLIIIAFLPTNVPDNVVCVIVSFVSAMQTNVFRKLSGLPYATTMCTGNLRLASENLFKYFVTKDKDTLKKSLQIFIIIFTFIFGAFVGTLCTMTISKYSTVVGAVVLINTLVFIIYKQKKIHKVENII